MKRPFVIDIDNTVINSGEMFLQHLCEVFNYIKEPPKVQSYNWAKVFGCSQQFILNEFDKFVTKEGMQTIKLYPGAKKGIEKLAELRPILFLTDRPPHLNEASKDYFAHHLDCDFNYQSSNPRGEAPHKGSRKLPFLQKHNALAFVDDATNHAFPAHNAGIPTILKKTEYHRNVFFPIEKQYTNNWEVITQFMIDVYKKEYSTSK